MRAHRKYNLYILHPKILTGRDRVKQARNGANRSATESIYQVHNKYTYKQSYLTGSKTGTGQK